MTALAPISVSRADAGPRSDDSTGISRHTVRESGGGMHGCV